MPVISGIERSEEVQTFLKLRVKTVKLDLRRTACLYQLALE